MDHVIIGENDYFSFLEEEMLNNKPHTVEKGENKDE